VKRGEVRAHSAGEQSSAEENTCPVQPRYAGLSQAGNPWPR